MSHHNSDMKNVNVYEYTPNEPQSQNKLSLPDALHDITERDEMSEVTSMRDTISRIGGFSGKDNLDSLQNSVDLSFLDNSLRNS